MKMNTQLGYLPVTFADLTDDALWYRKWFSIRWRICPCHGDFFALQLLNAAEMVNDMQHISHALCWMVYITL